LKESARQESEMLSEGKMLADAFDSDSLLKDTPVKKVSPKKKK